MNKTRLNLSIDKDLAEFTKAFAAENRITVADLFTQYVLGLKKYCEGRDSEPIIANPAFGQAMEDVKKRLRNGDVAWHSYDEVFGD